MTDGPAPLESIEALEVRLTRDAEQLAAKVLRLRLVHERAIARQTPAPGRRDD